MAHRLRPIRLLATLVAAVLAVSALLVAAQAWTPAPAAAQADEPLPEMAFVANAFDFPDALAASAVAGSLGAPVILTPGGGLDANADRALATADPDVVVVVGGTAVISETVVTDIAAKGYTVQRVAGATRTATAAELVDFAELQGYDRPVVTGREVAAGTIPGLDAEFLRGLAPDELGGSGDSDRLDEIEARLEALETENAALLNEVDTLSADNTELQATLDGVTRSDVDGRDTLQFAGMNVQVVNSTDTTDGTPNGLGNLIIGYNAPRGSTDPAVDRAGSHYLIVGDWHHWTSYGGLLTGFGNTVSGPYASVSGGISNTASSEGASVSGGFSNTASNSSASVSGGAGNEASGARASVSGGVSNTASGGSASVSGGSGNEASGARASVSGGSGNTASGGSASVTGGEDNTAGGFLTTVAGGHNGTVSNDHDSLIGNQLFADAAP